MDLNRKFISVVSRLNRLTQEGHLKWRRMDIPTNLTVGTDDVVTSFYGTKFEGHNVGIFEIRYKAYNPDLDKVYWTNNAAIALFTENWEKEWTFPYVAGIDELMRSVEYQNANVDTFISKLLGNVQEQQEI